VCRVGRGTSILFAVGLVISIGLWLSADRQRQQKKKNTEQGDGKNRRSVRWAREAQMLAEKDTAFFFKTESGLNWANSSRLGNVLRNRLAPIPVWKYFEEPPSLEMF